MKITHRLHVLPRHKLGEILNEFDVYPGEAYTCLSNRSSYLRVKLGYRLFEKYTKTYSENVYLLTRSNSLSAVQITARMD